MKLTKGQKTLIYATILDNKYIPVKPTKKQLEALLREELEIFYGGAVAGGKSEFLLMSALQYVEDPSYSGLLLRDTFPNLIREGSLIPRSHEWLAGTEAKWRGQEKKWIFPSGATLEFGHLEHELDKHKYQSAEFQFIGFDEITSFTESQFTYLFSRNRRKKESKVPLRVRATGNPDGPGFSWVKKRWVRPGHPTRPFIASRLEDNPHIDAETYLDSLSNLDPVLVKKLREGDWEVKEGGSFFDVSKIEILDYLPRSVSDVMQGKVRRWDLAATEAAAGKDPDFTVGMQLGLSDGILYIMDVVRGQWGYDTVNKTMRSTAQADGIDTAIRCEEEPGSSGKRNSEFLLQHLMGFDFLGVRSTGAKDVRARPVASWINQGKVKMLKGHWNEALLDELVLFPNPKVHDDQVDTLSGGFLDLSTVQYEDPSMGSSDFYEQQESEIF